MSNPTVVITNNSKNFGIDLTKINKTKYRIDSNVNQNTGDNYVNIKFFLNTDYVYNSTDNILVVISSYSNDQIVRYEEFVFKLEDIFFDKLINLNTDYVTIFFDNSNFFDTSGNIILTPITYASINGNITQIKIPLVSRIYGSSNVPIKTDIFGKIDISGQRVIVHGEVDISGQRIDISGQRVDISGQRIDISGQQINSNIRDSNGNIITSTIVEWIEVDDPDSLDSSVTIMTPYKSAIGTISYVHDIISNSVTKLTSSGNFLNVQLAGIYEFGLDNETSVQLLKCNENGNLYTCIRDNSGNNINADENGNLNVNIASNTSSNFFVNIQDSSGNSINTDENGNLGVRIQDSSGNSINTDENGNLGVRIQDSSGNNILSTTNFNYQTGLNIYPIVPKTKVYTIGGYDANSASNCMIVGASTANISVSTYNFGVNNPRIFYALLVNSATKKLFYDYVDPSGNLILDASANINNVSGTSLGSMISIVDFRMDVSGFSASADALYIGINNTSTTTLRQTSIYYEDINQKLIGVFTIPNGYIGCITYISSLVASVTGIQMNRWLQNGSRSAIWRINNTGNIYVSAGYDGCLGQILTEGESVAFSSQSAITGKSVIACITLKAIN